MKLFKRTALATAIAFTAILPTIESAEAAPRSYFQYVDNYAKYPSIQINFVNSMIANYTRALSTFDNILVRFARYSSYAFYKNIQTTRDWYAAELALYQTKLEQLTGGTKEVTVVKTETSKSVQYEQLTSAPVEIESYENVVEEPLDGIMYVYAVLTSVFQTTITINELTTTTTITYYSDNTTKSDSKTEVTNTEVRYDTETKVKRELINQYAIVEDNGEGTPTLNVLTAEQYMARNDVNYAGTDAFVNAMRKAKSWMFDSYIRNEEGMYYLYGNNLDAVNAPEAWAKGWTGKGTKIAILDTGIDTDHTEFAGKIVGAKCFAYCDESNGTVEDLNRHGTHVAGIAAGALDGNGSTGVAFDADLLIAKVGNQSGAISMTGAAQALAWAQNQGADVANFSAGYALSKWYFNNLTQVEDGAWKFIYNGSEDHDIIANAKWDIYGNYDVMRTKYDFDPLKAMMNNWADGDMVVTIAAGNDGLAASTFPAQYAIYVDPTTGELAFDGRMLVVGSWDQQNQKLSTFSNGAGTICFDEIGVNGGNTCDSGYRVSDFYIMAPGSYVMSADNDGGFIALSGTSMAAPTVAGGVALVRQMWPHMKGENVVQLLLQTANKNLPNYNEALHGQGLMDLDRATQPIGDLGIPTGGRADGTTTEVSGGIALGGAVASVSALDNVMVLDDFDRDFYFNANDSIAKVDTRTMSYTVAHKDRINTNAYAGYTNTMNGGTENLLVGASEDMKSLNVAYDFDNGVSIGYLKEDDTFLGNSAKSSLMKVDGAQTVYVGYNVEKEAGDLTIFGGATVALTKANVDDSSLMKSMDTLVSNTANIGAELSLTANSSVGLVASLPVAIVSGSANFNVAQSVSANGDINYANVSSSLAGDTREYNIGAYYNFNEAKQYGDVEVSAYVEERINYLGQSGETDTAGGIKLKVRF